MTPLVRGLPVGHHVVHITGSQREIPVHVPVGRTNWRRFAVAVAVPTVVAGGLVLGMANGAVAASFAVSGQTFKISADRLEGIGFTQYGGVVTEKNGKQHPVATSGIARAKLYNLCQSVRIPKMPISLVITAGGGNDPAEAKELLIDMAELNGDATFTDINIGQDASTLNADGRKVHGEAGSFGQQADKVVIEDLRQVSWSTTAGTFALTGLNLKIDVAADGKPKECF
jgi:hypothetical protein